MFLQTQESQLKAESEENTKPHFLLCFNVSTTPQVWFTSCVRIWTNKWCKVNQMGSNTSSTNCSNKRRRSWQVWEQQQEVLICQWLWNKLTWWCGADTRCWMIQGKHQNTRVLDKRGKKCLVHKMFFLPDTQAALTSTQTVSTLSTAEPGEITEPATSNKLQQKLF